jgi:hypothetical protein
LISPEYWGGRNFVKASVVSYMWLSASKTGKSTMDLGMTTSVGTGPLRRRVHAEAVLGFVFNFDVNIT